jgi:hypothetical protein
MSYISFGFPFSFSTHKEYTQNLRWKAWAQEGNVKYDFSATQTVFHISS